VPSQSSSGAMLLVLLDLMQAGADILSFAMPPPKPSGWLAGIGLRKKAAK
jgi:hypothetical protein